MRPWRLEAARDTYTRRMEGVSLWVVPSAQIVASDPGDAGELFEPAADKVYRHPTFYSIPEKHQEHLMPNGNVLFQYACRLGDDSLILGQRLSEWCGHAPMLETDLSLANIALDLVGQATYFLNYAGAIENAGRDGDALAFRRDVLDFHTAFSSSSPMAISRKPSRGNSCSRTGRN